MNEPFARTPALHVRIAALSDGSEDLSWLAPTVRARVKPGASLRAVWRFTWAVPLTAAALFAVVAAGLGTWAGNDPRAGDGGTERVKGPAASLSIYRQTGSGSERLENGSLAHAGDVIRIGYRVAGSGFGTIVSVDGRGVVTQHLPANATRAITLTNGAVVLLDQAYELDDAPEWERFFIVTGQDAFDIQPIVQAARQLSDAGASSALPLSPDFEQSTFLLKKDTRP